MARITHIPEDGEAGDEPAKPRSVEERLADMKETIHALVDFFCLAPKQREIQVIMTALQSYHDLFMDAYEPPDENAEARAREKIRKQLKSLFDRMNYLLNCSINYEKLAEFDRRDNPPWEE